MLNTEKITQNETCLNEVQLNCSVNAIIDLHTLSVRTSQQFYLSKKFKKLAYALSCEIAVLQPKPSAVNIYQAYVDIVDQSNQMSNLKVC